MIQTPPLSGYETRVLAWADEHGAERVGTRDVAQLLGSAVAAHKTLSSLAAKGVLDRIGRGLYVVRPLRAVGAPWALSALVAVAHLMAGSTYYVGGRTALALHRLTTQVYGAVVDVFVPSQRRRRRLAQAQVLFHPLDGDLFSFGIEHRSVEGADVAVSDPERTLLDLVDRPRSLVGTRRAHEIVSSAVDRVDVDRLVAYAARWPKSSTRQRLGFLLERAGTARARLAPLAASLGPGRTVAPLHAGDPVRGPIDPRWLVATGGEA